MAAGGQMIARCVADDPVKRLRDGLCWLASPYL